MSERQFVRCTFASGGHPYTYHNDGPPLGVGDTAQVEARGERKTVRVVGFTDKPPFETKLIIVAPA